MLHTLSAFSSTELDSIVMNLLHQFLFTWRYSMPVAAITIFAVLAVFHGWSGSLDTGNAPSYFSSQREYLGMVLLVVLMPPYLVVSLLYGTRRSLALAHQIDQANATQLSDRVTQIPLRLVFWFSLAGLLYAVIFNLPGFALNLFDTTSTEQALIVGQISVWMMLSIVLAVRVHVARGFRQVSRHVPVNIFETSNLKPFAQVGLIDVLTIAFGMVLSTVQSLDLSFRPDNYSKALVVILPAIIYLTLYPIWDIHKRLLALKKQELDMLNQKINNASKSLESAAINALEVLLQRRERTQAVSTWPMDVATLRTFLFYVIIPPLAWVGAALVEFLIDGFIQG